MSSRRRRKSKVQKPKKGGMSKLLAVALVVVLLLAVGGAFFGYQAVRSYLKSDKFRVMLSSQAGDLLGGEARFQPFIWDGWSVRTDRLDFKGKGAVQGFKVADINASVDIGAAWGGVYRIEDVSIRKVDLQGDFREKDGTLAEFSEPAVAEYSFESADAKKPFWASWLPTEIEVTALSIGSLSARALTDNGEWSLEGATVDVLPGAVKGNYDLTLRGAKVISPIELLDNLSLHEARGRYAGNQFHLLDSNGRAFERGYITLNGRLDQEEKGYEFLGSLSGVQLEEILPEDWKQRLLGELTAQFKAISKPDTDALLSGSLKIDRGTLTALPILDRIAAYTNTERFRRLNLSEASLDFKKQGERLELRKIVLASEGLVRVEGDLVLDGDVIRSGRFLLGITPGTLIHLPGAETKVFQRGKLGLLWAPINIGGTLENPTEDLSDRLIEAAGERMFELIPETSEWALKYSGEKLGDSTKELLNKHGVILGVANSILGKSKILIEKESGSVIERGKEVIDFGAGAAEEAVISIFDIFGRPIQKKE